MRMRSIVRSCVALAGAASWLTACSGIDGLPDQPRVSGDSGADSAVADSAVAERDAEVNEADAGATPADAGSAADATIDATADAGTNSDATITVDSGPCVPEGDVAFCTRLGKNCGTVTATDNCGAPRTVSSCGVCGSYYESCGGAGVPNACGCMPESDWSFCARLGRTCGNVSGTDNCGNARAVGSCGGACPADAGATDSGPADAGAPDASTVQRWTFTTCGATGAAGPTQAQCDTAYAGTSLAAGVSVTQGIQRWAVPIAGRYRIVAMGAQGGGATDVYHRAGLGALIQGEYDLLVGTAVRVLVGQQGLRCDVDAGVGTGEGNQGGGGGGSFAVGADGGVLVIAGGGGGSGSVELCPCMRDGIGYSTANGRGCAPASSADSLANCTQQSGDYARGEIGGCGTSLTEARNGGGGLRTTGRCIVSTGSGRSFESGGLGGGLGACAAGGFGGGGEGGYVVFSSGAFGAPGGGGGGGYSGGQAGYPINDSVRRQTPTSWLGGAGGGGGSFSNGDNPTNFSGYREGDGAVIVERIR
jgi:hypothetical protein